MRLEIGQYVYSKTVKTRTESAASPVRGFITFKMKKVEAVSLLLGTDSPEKPFTQAEEDKSLHSLGLIGFTDLLEYLPKKKVLEIEKARRKKLKLDEE